MRCVKVRVRVYGWGEGWPPFGQTRKVRARVRAEVRARLMFMFMFMLIHVM